MPKRQLKPKTILYPLPAVLVSCCDGNGNSNIITISYTGILSADPPLVYISVRPARFSYPMLKEGGDFVINIPGMEHLGVTDYCGVASGRNGSKFETTGLTELPASVVKSPLIAECPVNLECKITQVVPCGTHDVFMAEVVAAHADEGILTDGGKVDIAKVAAIAFCYDALEYWSLNARARGYGFTKGKLKSRQPG
ncbi:MAG: flavin reductase family protein [Deltaproteobacteria bacterium]|nr:flavin reductase family protein [Deltaproteobacteria bacterium]